MASIQLGSSATPRIRPPPSLPVTDDVPTSGRRVGPAGGDDDNSPSVAAAVASAGVAAAIAAAATATFAPPVIAAAVGAAAATAATPPSPPRGGESDLRQQREVQPEQQQQERQRQNQQQQPQQQQQQPEPRIAADKTAAPGPPTDGVPATVTAGPNVPALAAPVGAQEGGGAPKVEPKAAASGGQVDAGISSKPPADAAMSSRPPDAKGGLGDVKAEKPPVAAPSAGGAGGSGSNGAAPPAPTAAGAGAAGRSAVVFDSREVWHAANAPENAVLIDLGGGSGPPFGTYRLLPNTGAGTAPIFSLRNGGRFLLQFSESGGGRWHAVSPWFRSQLRSGCCSAGTLPSAADGWEQRTRSGGWQSVKVKIGVTTKAQVEAEWRKADAATNCVVMNVATGSGHYSYVNGAYDLVRLQSGADAPLFRRRSGTWEPAWWLYYSHAGRWTIGSTRQKDRREPTRRVMSAECKAGTLPQAATGWERLTPIGWMSTFVKCAPMGRKMMQETWKKTDAAASAPVLEISGDTVSGGLFSTSVNGKYNLVPAHSPLEPPAYQRRPQNYWDRDLWLYFGRDHRWYVGSTRDKDERRVGRRLRSAEGKPGQLPQAVGGWEHALIASRLFAFTTLNCCEYGKLPGLNLHCVCEGPYGYAAIFDCPAWIGWRSSAVKLAVQSRMQVEDAWKKADAPSIPLQVTLRGSGFTRLACWRGVYDLQQIRSLKDPVYKKRTCCPYVCRLWLYAGRDGRWYVGGTQKKSQRDPHWRLRSAECAPGTHPGEAKNWESFRCFSWFGTSAQVTIKTGKDVAASASSPTSAGPLRRSGRCCCGAAGSAMDSCVAGCSVALCCLPSVCFVPLGSLALCGSGALGCGRSLASCVSSAVWQFCSRAPAAPATATVEAALAAPALVPVPAPAPAPALAPTPPTETVLLQPVLAGDASGGGAGARSPEAPPHKGEDVAPAVSRDRRGRPPGSAWVSRAAGAAPMTAAPASSAKARGRAQGEVASVYVGGDADSAAGGGNPSRSVKSSARAERASIFAFRP